MCWASPLSPTLCPSPAWPSFTRWRACACPPPNARTPRAPPRSPPAPTCPLVRLNHGAHSIRTSSLSSLLRPSRDESLVLFVSWNLLTDLRVRSRLKEGSLYPNEFICSDISNLSFQVLYIFRQIQVGYIWNRKHHWARRPNRQVPTTRSQEMKQGGEPVHFCITCRTYSGSLSCVRIHSSYPATC